MEKTLKLLALILLTLNLNVSAKLSGVIVDPKITLIDGGSSPYNQLAPGDTIYLLAGKWDNLLIRNFKGASGKPFVFINKAGVVRFDTDHNHAISVQNCQFFKITGTGTCEFYGIQIDWVQNGTGIGVGGLSSDFELDHISIKNVPIAGIYAKTDPDCLLTSVRGTFTQKNTVIHDNYIENAGNEGLYVGNTNYLGQTVNCDGKDIVLLPSLLENVKIYNNIIKNSGWDGIQVSSASKGCEVYGNKIYGDSQAEIPNQMAGIILGGGSKCNCYNNLIVDGKGDGIELHGLGGSRIYNNIIVNPGRSYFPDDFSSAKMKHGIFVSDVSVEADSSFFIQNNTIISPKSDGIRFSSVKSRHNLIASNAIINPGNFDYYENGNTRFRGIDSYVMIPDANSDLDLRNNCFVRELSLSGIDDDYSLRKGSPLIDSGYNGKPLITFDFTNKTRPIGIAPDIGAMEYDPQTAINPEIVQQMPEILVSPNPVKDLLYIGFLPEMQNTWSFSVYNLSGMKVMTKDNINPSGAIRIAVDVSNLVPGIYLYSIRSSNQVFSGKLVKKE